MISVLAPILVSLGAPLLGSILRTIVGGVAGEASAHVIDALARVFGAQPTPEAVKAAIEADPQAASKVQVIERERSAEWVAYLTMATSQRNRMLDREDERGTVFSWGWRPAMSWMLLFLWTRNVVILPVVNATAVHRSCRSHVSTCSASPAYGSRSTAAGTRSSRCWGGEQARLLTIEQHDPP